jgi:prepilin-type N-terminal cleavage/methylation domain-containing protein
MHTKKRKRQRQDVKRRKGFTLIELLLVFGILTILFSITLIAINPLEQANRTNDIVARATAEDFIKANNFYYLEKKVLPWVGNTACSNEIALGGTLDIMPNCIEELTQVGVLKDKYIEQAGMREIRLNKCGDSAVICYHPKSKEEYANATYDKFGVNRPGCPGNSNSPECYWCKPVMNNATCTAQPSSTPTLTPTPTSIPNLVAGYANDQTKLFKTYAVFFFDYPGFPPTGAGWNIHLSLRSDFGGDYTQTNRSFATGSDNSHTSQAISWVTYRALTMKYAAYQSLAGQYSIYNSNCGKTVYYRVANWYNPSATDKKEGSTYTGVIDCITKVGVVDPPLSWYTVYDQLNNTQKQYDVSWDFDNNGVIDWTDYWLGAFSTKTRYGGWQTPE